MLRPINRRFSLQVTESNPQYGKPEPRITLYKWWPGGKASFHIPSASQWEQIEQLINGQLGPFLGWRGKKEVLRAVRAASASEAATDKEVKGLLRDHPDILRRIVGALDPARIGEEGVEQVVEVMQEVVGAAGRFDAAFRTAFLKLVRDLPRQKQRAIEDLEGLLATWSLQQVTTVAQQVKGRLATIELLRTQIKDPRTYEIRGKNSIHRILERAMWLVDERYWLLQSNETLRSFIGEQMSKEDRKRWGSKRPDFVCGTIGDRLIILELKRPAHTLEIEDLNQVETYITLAEKYSKFRSYEAYLVGQKVSDDLNSRRKHRSSAFNVLTYTDLLGSAEQRYRTFVGDSD